MEVRIGVRNVPREVTFESDQTPDEVHDIVSKALDREDGVIALNDDKGRLVIVPAAALGYVEVGPAGKGRVGFGNA